MQHYFLKKCIGYLKATWHSFCYLIEPTIARSNSGKPQRDFLSNTNETESGSFNGRITVSKLPRYSALNMLRGRSEFCPKHISIANYLCIIAVPFRVSLLLERRGPCYLENMPGHFYDKWPTFGCSHWWKFVSTEFHNDVIMTYVIATGQPVVTFHDVIFFWFQ